MLPDRNPANAALSHGKPPCLSEKAAETTSPAAVGFAVKESVQGKPRHWAKVVAGFPAPFGKPVPSGAAGATLPGGDVFRSFLVASSFGRETRTR
jgi:hypothetical protein